MNVICCCCCCPWRSTAENYYYDIQNNLHTYLLLLCFMQICTSTVVTLKQQGWCYWKMFVISFMKLCMSEYILHLPHFSSAIICKVKWGHSYTPIPMTIFLSLMSRKYHADSSELDVKTCVCRNDKKVCTVIMQQLITNYFLCSMSLTPGSISLLAYCKGLYYPPHRHNIVLT